MIKKPKSDPVDDNWTGETVVCIGGGPSLTPADVLAVAGKARIIAINDAYKLAPFADLLYACDRKWWQWHHGAPYFLGEKWTQDIDAAKQYGLNYINGVPGGGINTETGLINHGRNGGHQAINLAYHKGARRVILLGYDMKAGAGGEQHWFGDHPDKLSSNRGAWCKEFEVIAQQGLLDIINCSRDTALRCFPIQQLGNVTWI